MSFVKQKSAGRLRGLNVAGRDVVEDAKPATGCFRSITTASSGSTSSAAMCAGQGTISPSPTTIVFMLPL